MSVPGSKLRPPSYRMIAMCEDVDGKLVSNENIGFFNQINDICDWAAEIVKSGSALYIDIYQGDLKITTVHANRD